jgi:uncharacterized delta-60 repeat protein
MKQLILTLCLLSLTSLSAYSQPAFEWEARYNAHGWPDLSQDMVLDAQGNIYITGYTTNAAGTTDMTTIKYNSAGAQQWKAVYNGPRDSNDFAYKLAVDNQGNVYVAGDSRGIGTQEDFTLIKYNPAGVEQWVKRLNGTYNRDDKAQDVTVDSQGNVYVTGYLNDGSPTYSKYFTVKYNSAGDELWSKTYNGTGLTDQAFFITLDAAGNVIVTGQGAFGPGNNSPDYVTIKYNSAGAEQWVARTGVSYHREEVCGIVTDGAGNIYITGTDERNLDSIHYLTVKYNPAGVQQWSHKFMGEDGNPDNAAAIEIDQNGYIYVTGTTAKTGEDGNTGTIKYNPTGTVEWTAYYRGYHQTIINRDQYPGDLEIDSDGNVYVCGYDYSHANLHKLNSSGALQWYKNYGPTTGDDAFYGIELDANNNIYVTGPSYGGTSNGFDYATVKYSQTVGIQNISSEIPDKYSLSQNYPNPFNPETNIEFALPRANKVRLSIYNFLGQEVAVLVNDQLDAGTYSYDWNASALPSGAYFYRLQADEFTETKKMLLIK